MNYINNNNQMDNNLLMNHYGLSEPPKSLQSNYPNQITTQIPDQISQPNQFINFSNDNLMNIANNIDPNSLNGTALDDNDMSKMFISRNKNNDNESLIKSLTKEIINNLKENNMSLYDNSSINSRNRKSNYEDNDENEDNITIFSSSNNSSGSKSKKHKKKKK